MNDEAAMWQTKPAGILQTPNQIFEHKRLVFDFRGTPIVNISKNEWEVNPPPKTVNGPSIKNFSSEIFKPQVAGGTSTLKASTGSSGKPPSGHNQSHK